MPPVELTHAAGAGAGAGRAFIKAVCNDVSGKLLQEVSGISALTRDLDATMGDFSESESESESESGKKDQSEMDKESEVE